MGSRHKIGHSPQRLNDLDNKVIRIINTINELIVEAQADDLAAVCTVLEDARESIGWWAAHDDYDHERGELLAQQMKFSSGLNIAATLLAKFSAIKDEIIKNEMLEIIRNANL